MWVKIKAFMEKNVIITLSIQKNFPNGKIKSKFMCNFAEIGGIDYSFSILTTVKKSDDYVNKMAIIT